MDSKSDIVLALPSSDIWSAVFPASSSTLCAPGLEAFNSFDSLFFWHLLGFWCQFISLLRSRNMSSDWWTCPEANLQVLMMLVQVIYAFFHLKSYNKEFSESCFEFLLRKIQAKTNFEKTRQIEKVFKMVAKFFRLLSKLLLITLFCLDMPS